MSEPIPVLIVGAGPVGLNLALQLHRYGVSFRIIDIAREIDASSRAIGVQPSTLEQYDTLGFVDRILAKGITFKAIASTRSPADRHARIIADVQAVHAEYGKYLPTGVSQADHEEILVDELQKRGVEIERGTRFVSLAVDAGKGREGIVEVTVEKPNGDQEVVRARWVAGADGGRSSVRKSLGIKMEGGTYEQRFFVADVIATSHLPQYRDCVMVCVSPRDFATTVPYGSDSHRIICSVPSGLEDVPDEEITFPHCEETLRRNIDLTIAKLKHFAVYRSHHRVASATRSGHVLLLGDACHLHSPVGGQGLNLGVGDALNLGWKLAATLKGAPDSLVDTYQAERRQTAQHIVARSDAGFQRVTASGWRGYVFRILVVGYLAPLIHKVWSKWVSRKAFWEVSQLGQAYPNSPLTEGKGAGGRFPLEYRDDFVGWTVHAVGPEPAWMKGLRSRLEKKVGLLTHDKAAKLNADKVYVVRPDGFIGMVADKEDAEGVERYLCKWGILA